MRRGSTSSCCSAADLSAQRGLVRLQHLVAQALERADVDRRSAVAVGRRRRAGARADRASASRSDAQVSSRRSRSRAASSRRTTSAATAALRSTSPAWMARASAARCAMRVGVIARGGQRPLRLGEQRLGGATLRRRAARSTRALRPGGRRARRSHRARAPVSAATRSRALRQPRLVVRRAVAAAPRPRRSPSPGDAARTTTRRPRRRPARSCARTRPVSAASRSSASRSAATRSRSSLISRLVAENAARLDLAAAGDEMCAAQHVAVERSRPARSASRASVARVLERLDDDRFADRLAQRAASNSPVMRATIGQPDRAAALGERSAASARTSVAPRLKPGPSASRRRSAGSTTTKPQRPASSLRAPAPGPRRHARDAARATCCSSSPRQASTARS